MADIFSPKSLSELIGGPLIAMVQGEAMAAQTTVQFIREVGFEKKEDSDEKDFGDLRMITFQYNKTGIDGKSSLVEMKLPILSIVPIPALQIKNATVDFNVQLTSHEDAPATSEKTNLSGLKPNPFLKQVPSLRGIISQKSGSAVANNDTTSNSFNMKINIQLEQADLTVGLQQIFGILEHGSNETEITPK